MAYTGAQEFQELGRPRRSDGAEPAPAWAPVSWPIIELAEQSYVTAVIHRVTHHEAQALALVMPHGMTWTEADFELLARRAAGVRKSLVIVSSDRALRARAHTVGLKTVASLNHKLARGGWSHPPQSAGYGYPAGAINATGAIERTRWPVATRRRREQLTAGSPPPPPLTTGRPPHRALVVVTRAMILIFAMLSGLIVLGLGLAALPSGSITLRPATQTVETTFEVVARSGVELDPRTAVIPARQVEVVLESKAEATPTGVRTEADQRASGFVQFLNRRSESIPIPFGALVETSGGTRVRFRTTQAAVLPAGVGVTLRVPIIAVEAGAHGNVPANTINALEPALALVAGVVNDTPTTGGTTRESAIVTEEDRQRLQRDLRAQLETEVVAALRAQLAQGERLALESLDFQVLSERWDRDPGRPDYAGLTLRLLARGLGYQPDLAGAVAPEALEKQAPSGFRLLSNHTGYVVADQERVSREAGAPSLRLWVRAWGTAVANIDRQAVRHNVRGLTPQTAIQTLSSTLSLAEPAWASVGPPWLAERWNRLPWLPLRIDVVVLGEGQ